MRVKRSRSTSRKPVSSVHRYVLLHQTSTIERYMQSCVIQFESRGIYQAHPPPTKLRWANESPQVNMTPTPEPQKRTQQLNVVRFSRVYTCSLTHATHLRCCRLQLVTCRLKHTPAKPRTLQSEPAHALRPLASSVSSLSTTVHVQQVVIMDTLQVSAHAPLVPLASCLAHAALVPPGSRAHAALLPTVTR